MPGKSILLPDKPLVIAEMHRSSLNVLIGSVAVATVAWLLVPNFAVLRKIHSHFKIILIWCQHLHFHFMFLVLWLGLMMSPCSQISIITLVSTVLTTDMNIIMNAIHNPIKLQTRLVTQEAHKFKVVSWLRKSPWIKFFFWKISLEMNCIYSNCWRYLILLDNLWHYLSLKKTTAIWQVHSSTSIAGHT